ncbi:hypothetical protein R3W88_031895 [Solanum pinnatisectum]|uniref:Retrotransposon gag domain-containing protein n=1 Tax=Solanum pinnatisectum TaxID=50273 RepID=A0AAV9LN98_9SOLN|nr:hypothetical protein R3W88_031895 [Solanum pinnatisectum]
MRAEINKTQDLTNLAIIAYTPTLDNGRPPLHFPISDPTPEHFPNNSSTATIPKPPIIDLTTPNPRHASFSHQTSPTPQNPNFPPIQQILTQIIQNPPTTQPIPLKTACQNSTLSESQPLFTTQFELDHYEKKENEWKVIKGKDEQNIKERVLNAMKDFQYTPDIVGLNCEDFCIHPHLDLPKGFTVPKFDTFSGVENPFAHLRAYCNQFVGFRKDETLLMRLFSRTLKGEAFEGYISQEMKQWPSWNALANDFIERFGYNVEFNPDRYSLERIKLKSWESYREYAYRWRREVAKVRPPMTKKEIIEVFVHIQELEYYNRMLLILGGKFSEIVKIGEAIEDGLKTGKIIRTTPHVESPRPLTRKREDVSSISFELSQKSKRHAGHYVQNLLPSKTYPLATQNPYPIQPNYQSSPPNYPNYQTPPPNYPNFQAAPLNLLNYQAP